MLPTTETLNALYQWAMTGRAELPHDLVELINALDEAAFVIETSDVLLLELVVAIGQLREDTRAYLENDFGCRQQDGSPSPRFWAAARLVLVRSSPAPDPRLLDVFTSRARGLRVAPPTADEPEDDEPISWEVRNEAKTRVLTEFYEHGGTSAAIAARLRRRGIQVSQQRVAAIIGHAQRELAEAD